MRLALKTRSQRGVVLGGSYNISIREYDTVLYVASFQGAKRTGFAVAPSFEREIADSNS